MARPKISFLPDTLDLAFYAGDGASLQLTVTNSDQTPKNVDGTVIAQIRVSQDSDPVADFSVDTENATDGVLVLSLTGAQTQEMLGEQSVFKGIWDVQWDPVDLEPVTLIQGRVECYPDVSR